MTKKEIILRLVDIDKQFGGVHALNHVSLTIQKGEVHAIVGENGAGKSTLMKILAGTYQPDSGKIVINGKNVSFNNPHQAHQAGVDIIYQEFFCFPALDVVANVFAGKEIQKNGLLNEKEMRKRTLEVFNRIGIYLDPDAKLCDLSVADQQIIEIAKALVYKGKIVIMDEPNSALTDKETKALFNIIERLKQQGVTILYISHRLEEVFQICDRISVLRDGNYMGTWEKEETNIPFIISQMIGKKLEEAFPNLTKLNKDTEAILEVSNLNLDDRLVDINFSLRPGEILGFAGLEGSGVRDLFHILFGIKSMDSGKIFFDGSNRDIGFSNEAMKIGWALVPANRRDHGLIIRWSVKDNITLVILRKLLNVFGIIKEQKIYSVAEDYIERLRISTESADKRVFELSGGNQQKVVISKWLATKPKILILDDPTRGIDVGAKAEIYNLIQDLAKQGLAILFNSSEIDEVVGLCHRILVMRQGRIIKNFIHEEVDKERVLRYVSGELNELDLKI